jgi:hypothetical protein
MMFCAASGAPLASARRRLRSDAAHAAIGTKLHRTRSRHHGSAARTVQPRQRIFGITEIEGGFPHSEIRGSKVVRTSPRLIAAYHVLHRLSAPRHPPNTLKALDRSHYQYPLLGRGMRREPHMGLIERPFASNISENVAVKPHSQLAARLLERCEARSPHECGQSILRSINDRICFLFTMTDSKRIQAQRAQMRIRFPRTLDEPQSDAPAI